MLFLRRTTATRPDCNLHIPWSWMLSCSQTSAGIHHPNDYHVDADLQIPSPPVRETPGTSMEALSSGFHPSQTSSAARHPRRLRLSWQESRADILVMVSSSEAASFSTATNHLCLAGENTVNLNIIHLSV